MSYPIPSLVSFTSLEPSRLHPFSANFEASRTPSPRSSPHLFFGSGASPPKLLPNSGYPRCSQRFPSPRPPPSEGPFESSQALLTYRGDKQDIEQPVLFTFESHDDGTDTFVTFRQPSPNPTSLVLTPPRQPGHRAARPSTPAPPRSVASAVQKSIRKRRDRKRSRRGVCWEPSLSTIWEIDQRYWRQWGFTPSPSASPSSATTDLSLTARRSSDCPESPSPRSSPEELRSFRNKMLVEADKFDDAFPSRNFSMDSAVSDEPESIVTPRCEEDDPFALNNIWDSLQLITPKSTPPRKSSPRASSQTHRPPPLDLSKRAQLPSVRLSNTSDQDPFIAGSLGQSALLSPLPVASSGVLKARYRSVSAPETSSPNGGPRRIQTSWSSLTSDKLDELEHQPGTTSPDIDVALEMLLATCGESYVGLKSQSSTRSSTTLSPDSDFSESELFYQRPCERLAPSISLKDRESHDLAYAFPLPPVRPVRTDDMGLTSLFGSASSPSLITPTTPPAQLSKFHKNPSTPTPPELKFIPYSPPRRRSPRSIPNDWKPTLVNRHSALQALSRGEDIPAPTNLPSPLFSDYGSTPSLISAWSDSGDESSLPGSSKSSKGSSSSRKSLPKRGKIPESWKAKFGGHV